MLLISLDEGGRFERGNGQLRSMMIGGGMFRCDSAQDVNRERDRLVRLYRKICDEQQASFPADLHYNRDAFGAITNLDSANRVKAALIAALPAFFQGRDSWSDDRPHGTYLVYALLGDPQGMASMNHPGLSNLMNDEVCGNRYEHMAYRAVQNLLFYDLSGTDPDVQLDLATRVLALDGNDQLTAEAKTLGLRGMDRADGQESDSTKRHLTDAGSFRAMLSQSILDSGRTDLNVDLKVRSIHYAEDSAWKHAFLYLADTLCSAYQEAVGTSVACHTAIGALEACCKRLAGRHYRLWAYHDMDEQYRQAVRLFRQKDFFGAMQAVQAIRHQQNKLAEFYDRAWLAGIERRIAATDSQDALKIALIRLADYLESHDSNLSDAIAMHRVFRDQLASTKLDMERDAGLLFLLHKTAMTISNHTGNYEAALQAYQECLKYAQYVSVEDYLEIQNMLAVAQHDSMQMDRAVETVKATLDYERVLLDIKKEIYPDCGNIHIHYGRTCSQMGQYYAFAGQYGDACKSFLDAFAAFGTDETEIARTRSYYLHALIEAGERTAYEEEAAKYFGAPDILAQFQRISWLEATSAKFALYVYVKALYVFYRKTVNAGDLRTIIRSLWNTSATHLDHHPWEMILKYCAFLMVDRNLTIRECKPDDLMQRAAEAVQRDRTGILPEIVKQNAQQYEQVKNGRPAFADTTLTYMYR